MDRKRHNYRWRTILDLISALMTMEQWGHTNTVIIGQFFFILYTGYYENLEGSNKEDFKKSRNYEIKSRNYEIKVVITRFKKLLLRVKKSILRDKKS